LIGYHFEMKEHLDDENLKNRHLISVTSLFGQMNIQSVTVNLMLSEIRFDALELLNPLN
jgi:hypothetical protein